MLFLPLLPPESLLHDFFSLFGLHLGPFGPFLPFWAFLAFLWPYWPWFQVSLVLKSSDTNFEFLAFFGLFGPFLAFLPFADLWPCVQWPLWVLISTILEFHKLVKKLVKKYFFTSFFTSLLILHYKTRFFTTNLVFFTTFFCFKILKMFKTVWHAFPRPDLMFCKVGKVFHVMVPGTNN